MQPDVYYKTDLRLLMETVNHDFVYNFHMIQLCLLMYS